MKIASPSYYDHRQFQTMVDISSDDRKVVVMTAANALPMPSPSPIHLSNIHISRHTRVITHAFHTSNTTC